MKNVIPFLLLFFLIACSSPADKNMLDYEQSLCRADSLARCGIADSARTVRLLSDLHRDYTQVKENSRGKRVRLKAVSGTERFLWGAFSVLMFSISAYVSVGNFRFRKERRHRSYLVSLSENEQRLRNNELERSELQECLDEMSLTDEERDEVHRSLLNLMEHGNHLHRENEALRMSLKEYETHPVPRELELLNEQTSHIRLLRGRVQTLTATLIEGDEVMHTLRLRPKFLTDAHWLHLRQLADRVYDGFSSRLARRFPQLTPADLQLCLLMRLGFINAQIATLTAVSPATVSQQKFRLKKRLAQTDETLFNDGETVDRVVCGC